MATKKTTTTIDLTLEVVKSLDRLTNASDASRQDFRLDLQRITYYLEALDYQTSLSRIESAILEVPKTLAELSKSVDDLTYTVRNLKVS